MQKKFRSLDQRKQSTCDAARYSEEWFADYLQGYNSLLSAQFDIYHLCLKLYCDEYDKLFLRSNIIENLEDLNVLQIMKLIDRLRHFTYKAYEVESLIRSNDRQSHEKDSDTQKVYFHPLKILARTSTPEKYLIYKASTKF